MSGDEEDWVDIPKWQRNAFRIQKKYSWKTGMGMIQCYIPKPGERLEFTQGSYGDFRVTGPCVVFIAAQRAETL